MRYSDYFPKSTLYRCGVLPDDELVIEGAVGGSNSERYDAIDKNMRSIFDKFTSSLRSKAVDQPEKVALEMGVGRRIVAAFYDVGVLDERDRERYPMDAARVFENQQPQRERLVISELAESFGSDRSPKNERISPAIPQKERGL